MTDRTDPYPLLLEPILMPKVWGGRRLAGLGKVLPEGNIGESWELADLSATNASGGGGAPARSRILNGPMAGKTVHDAVQAWGPAMLGDARPTPEGGFPLLVKYLDAREHLSVQVHPSPAYAAAHPDAHLKTESWVVLAADPGADGSPPVIYAGLKPGTTRESLAAAIHQGRVPEIMQAWPAVVGECWTLPSGTVHALGAGVLVAEVQTPSDTTFRIYDWQTEYARAKREMHTDQALASADLGPPPRALRAEGQRTQVARTEFYRIEVLRAHCEAVPLLPPLKPGAPATGSPALKEPQASAPGHAFKPEAPATGSVLKEPQASAPGHVLKPGATATGSPPTPLIIMLPRTMGASIATEGCPEVAVGPGQTVLVPAALAGAAVLRAGPGTMAVVAGVG